MERYSNPLGVWGMKKEIRIWWEEVADQYEEWADEPPRYPRGNERYTCHVLEDVFGPLDAGEWGCFHGFKEWYIHELWIDVYPNSEIPIGTILDKDRPEKRFHFCHHMAETIREHLETER